MDVVQYQFGLWMVWIICRTTLYYLLHSTLCQLNVKGNIVDAADFHFRNGGNVVQQTYIYDDYADLINDFHFTIENGVYNVSLFGKEPLGVTFLFR